MIPIARQWLQAQKNNFSPLVDGIKAHQEQLHSKYIKIKYSYNRKLCINSKGLSKTERPLPELFKVREVLEDS
ncbi:hypothetical protein L1278_000557 [Pontibacter sp. HSC-36F09]|nr:hypothetical protein [Pontibacter sp. HSC-36F09]